MSLHLPTVRAAAVQAAPVFLDTARSIDKLETLVEQAANNGAELVVFGETFLPGFPTWTGVLPPIDQHDLHKRLFQEAIVVPGPETDRLGRIARQHDIVLSVGINERAEHTLGQLFNSNLIFDRNGQLVNHRRKIVATYHERLTWSHGDAHDMKPVDLDGWNLGALICGENTNTLARYSLLAQGERIHISTYPSTWPFDGSPDRDDYDLTESIRIRSAAHCFEGKVFNIVAATALDDDAVDAVANGDQQIEARLRGSRTVSLILDPAGRVIAGPTTEPEEIIYATIDVADEIIAKKAQDIVGTYNRFDIFSVTVDQTRHVPLIVTMADAPVATVEEVVL
ncbi:carbon-nitrogen hydrolase family protein [Microbacterium dauci]|uniref:Carbon-nitrogen hydrolase family protein n=1 Tax=Microbacterium dauci TaxID=3048008 RepID=A0ABT6ZFH6_9MICO|nr:carbon-nitrogen hydrolase family protein [Microbacterium sp. LX3-4]MDJ1114911.1 carbon-nitrogen hydrolase family protein [Microbacterium sp. LX3-4]